MEDMTSRPTKRMRLGTRSCAECRRRKVRCVYPAQSEVCQECEAHSTPCRKQGLSHPAITGEETKPEIPANGKLQELERVVEQLCRAVGLKGAATTASDLPMTQTGALRYLNPSHGNNILEDRGSHSPVSSVELSSHAPLLNALRQVVDFDRVDSANYHRTIGKHEQTILALRALVPRDDDLSPILEATHKYWPLWPISPPGLIHIIPSKNTADVHSGRDFVLESLQSETPEVVAKSILWLTLCIQQLPSDFSGSLPTSKDILIEALMNGADKLLRTDDDYYGSQDELECLMLQAKVYVNMGRPRKAWLRVRRAIASGLLQGLHHKDETKEKAMRKLWMQCWIFDRQLSMGLGVPYGVPRSHPSLFPDEAGGDRLTRLLQTLALIAGDIGDRNLSFQTASYSVTQGIERDLEQCRDLMPAEWWLPIVSADLSLVELYTRQVGRFYYALLRKMAHFPYMLDSAHKEYENSRSVALCASREMISCYLALRESSQGALVVCDLMDFQAFSAGVALIIDLLSAPKRSDGIQDGSDWGLVQRLTDCLQNLSRLMACAVASQAADVLKYLHLAGHGIYNSKPYEVKIPHLGKVRITRARQGLVTDTREGTPSGTNHSLPSPLNAIEFGAVRFPSPGMEFSAFCPPAEELGCDWMAGSSLDFDWDWNNVYYCPGSDMATGL